MVARRPIAWSGCIREGVPGWTDIGLFWFAKAAEPVEVRLIWKEWGLHHRSSTLGGLSFAHEQSNLGGNS